MFIDKHPFKYFSLEDESDVFHYHLTRLTRKGKLVAFSFDETFKCQNPIKTELLKTKLHGDILFNIEVFDLKKDGIRIENFDFTLGFGAVPYKEFRFSKNHPFFHYLVDHNEMRIIFPYVSNWKVKLHLAKIRRRELLGHDIECNVTNLRYSMGVVGFIFSDVKELHRYCLKCEKRKEIRGDLEKEVEGLKEELEEVKEDLKDAHEMIKQIYWAPPNGPGYILSLKDFEEQQAKVLKK
jgi:hypothetical protein